MFDTMTVTKVAAALCGALLVFLLGNMAASVLFNIAPAHHGEGEIHQAFVIDTGAGAETQTASAEAEVPFADVMAAADPAAGEKVFAKCKACHKVDGSNATGPHLDGVVERVVASVEGFGYSDAMKAHGGNWTPEELSHFLTNPKADVPGTKMSFAGLPKATDRANVIAYLQSLSN